jgi:hypothetical protein
MSPGLGLGLGGSPWGAIEEVRGVQNLPGRWDLGRGFLKIEWKVGTPFKSFSLMPNRRPLDPMPVQPVCIPMFMGPGPTGLVVQCSSCRTQAH